ncbi:SCP2 sterol-binding domain-containing protein [Aestuariivirga litoralis]|uniref:SCP2 sterol-binding domain-containing protein n=1 Tax=Aestuariivirga litoralis TaxID=2650924 RepID=UPI0018C5888A|nr:SCP2 sterol-binding domain-containing protein [Aestuariivirga litoralis]MBG1232591.1 SCP2 sterol-binding domain-containing protein [Aestuariivirga litoralis]
MADTPELEILQENLPKLTRMNSVLRFAIGDDEGYTIDARDGKAALVEDGSIEPDCTIKVSRENMVKLINGDMDPMLAYTLGRIKVQGDMGVAMKLVKAIAS